ncbi:hypothetical protein CIB95_09465 [Lottiidibacillus patelloidae]|uniref:Class II Histidinyl-tRNA synthetase (HisRS)-like catalytic core domain-containing protein n=1 Tax=Lottiidibacillus patelloidae TaxID=2670334 RepID=A0A263BTU9_9BACI|nr:ATP phosphoribosyltransferase regulatory subunit [Lottiidibacillus patelloidae]OZM56988.1 hypothetical protein CIB95_09465 [Lottiidibacillus patelloidae]
MDFLTINDELAFLKSKNKLKKELQELFSQAGFLEVEPSFIEDYDRFAEVNKRVKLKSMVKVLNGNGTISILRPDITSVIIKNYIPKWEVGTKLKLFYQSTVFENNGSSGINEWKQAGVEYLGEDSQVADQSILKLALSILNTYNTTFLFEIGNSKYLNGLFKELALTPTSEKKVKEFIYHKDEFGLKKYLKDLEINEKSKGLLSDLLSFQGTIEEVCEKSHSYFMNGEMEEAISELKDIAILLRGLGYSRKTVFDLAMVTTFDYYEGLIFKGYYPTIYQPIISGGRYDSLTEKYGKRVSAVGFKVDFSSLLAAINREGEYSE